MDSCPITAGQWTGSKREKIIDFGPIQMTANKIITLQLPPIVGGVTFFGGIVLLVIGGEKG